MTPANSLAAKLLDLLNSVRFTRHQISQWDSHPLSQPYLGSSCHGKTKTNMPTSAPDHHLFHLIPSGPSSFLLLYPRMTFSSQLFSCPPIHHLSYYFSSFLIQPSFHKAPLQFLLPKGSAYLNSFMTSPRCWGILQEGIWSVRWCHHKLKFSHSNWVLNHCY